MDGENSRFSQKRRDGREFDDGTFTKAYDGRRRRTKHVEHSTFHNSLHARRVRSGLSQTSLDRAAGDASRSKSTRNAPHARNSGMARLRLAIPTRYAAKAVEASVRSGVTG